MTGNTSSLTPPPGIFAALTTISVSPESLLAETSASNDADPAVLARLARRFTGLKCLAVGGQGSVHGAWDTARERPVALKLRGSRERGKESSDLAVREELRLLQRVRHPCVLVAHEIVEDPAGPVLVLERLHGVPLQLKVSPQSPLRGRGFFELAVSLAAALAAVHSAGILHRDVSPGNVLCLDGGGMKLIDFGCAVAREAPGARPTGEVVGTPGYVAPEVLDGKPAEPASDVHGLGSVLFHAGTGTPLLAAGKLEDLHDLRRRLPGAEEAVASAEALLPPGVAPLLARCVAFEPRHRPAAHVLCTALRMLSEHA